MNPYLFAMVTLASVGMFLSLWRSWVADADNRFLAALFWVGPAFVLSMAFAAVTIGVFYPAVKAVAGSVG